MPLRTRCSRIQGGLLRAPSGRPIRATLMLGPLRSLHRTCHRKQAHLEVRPLPGVLAYGGTSDEAIAKAQALALRVLADRLEHGEGPPEFVSISFAAA